MKYKIYITTILILLLTGCEIGTTGEAMIDFPVVVTGEPSASTFTSNDGWDISLTQADIILGPLYLCSHVPTFGKSGDSLTDCGKTMGEFKESVVIDALSGSDQNIGILNGISGKVNSVFYDHGYIWLSSMGQVENVNDELDMNSAVIKGTATKDGSSFDFEFDLVIKPIKKGMSTIMGAGVDGYQDLSTQRLSIYINPGRWLSNVNFEGLYSLPGDVKTITPDMTIYNTIYYGITSGSPIEFKWE